MTAEVTCAADFSQLWDCEFELVEDNNRRGLGWSQIGRIRFAHAGAASSSIAAFLKRQQRYQTRTPRYPIRGISTLRREYQMLQRVRGHGVAVATPLFFAEGSEQRAVLVVEALLGYQPLDELCEPDPAQRLRIIRKTAALVRKLHDLGICHRCLYPRHLFWNPDTGDLRLIDWEKARYSWLRNQTLQRDLDALNRHAFNWSLRERATFLAAYLGVPVGDPLVRRWWRRLSVKFVLKPA